MCESIYFNAQVFEIPNMHLAVFELKEQWFRFSHPKHPSSCIWVLPLKVSKYNTGRITFKQKEKIWTSTLANVAVWSTWVKGFITFTYMAALPAHSCAQSEPWKVCSNCQNTGNVRRHSDIFLGLWALENGSGYGRIFMFICNNIQQKG